MVLMPLSLSASMTRWKPSVNSPSGSAAGDFSFTAASAMGFLLLPGSSSASPLTPRLARNEPRPLVPARRHRRAPGQAQRGRRACCKVFPAFSIQIICVFRHMIGEAERMIPHQPLGAIRIAGLQRLDDVHVVADRFLHAVLLADRLAADHAHVGE